MKRFSFLLISLLACSALCGGLWYVLQPRGEPEVQKIYKVPHLKQKSEKQQQIKQIETSDVDFDSQKIQTLEETPRDYNISSILSKEGFSPEEEAAFWKWLATQHKDNLTEPANEKNTKAAELNLDTDSKKPTYLELSKLVRTVYDLKSILDSYDIEFDFGRAVCPFCSDRTLRTTVNGATGQRDFWNCRNCTGGRSKTMIPFVAKMEGIGEYEAAKLLAESAGLLD